MEKETELNTDQMRGELGVDMIWYWVKIYKGEAKHPDIQKCYRSEADALKVYNGFVEAAKTRSTILPVTELINQIEIPE